ncbi:MAG: glycoside hydrolase family 3 C-terminal domain-containing protein [Anaerolineae bacterium]|nr:glycoside hydrolase family 3 C-terminal domain-containing protein [Anaerolineae bacterium]
MKDIQALIKQMTLEEKASLCSGLDFWHLKGIERLGIPSLMVTDGPHGLRKQSGDADHVGLNESVPATCFPTASALASTWDRELVFQVGQALAEECRQEQVGVILGPGANIKRSPLCGRNFEYFSEDPYLTGEMAKSHIQGVQSKGIGTSLKHYAANNQEYRRMSIDALVDERTLREIYLPGFETAVKEAQPWTMMCSYNRLNGEYASEHPWLLNQVLRDEWGFQGLVVTDWGAVNDRVKGLLSGLDLEMPGSMGVNDARIVKAVRQGVLDESVLDRAVERILQMVFRALETLQEPYQYDADAHHALARKVAAEGSVLLKNDGILPLTKTCKVAILGEFAKQPRYQGSGSSRINPSRMDTAYEEYLRLAGADAVVGYAPGYRSNTDAVEAELIQEAVSLSRQAEVVIIFAGLTDTYESEGFDRDHMRMPANHNALIEAVAAANPNVVVVLSNGSPVEMPWLGKVKAVLEGYLGGQVGGGAAVDLLLGLVNPGGKLAETFPVRLEDTPCYPYFPGGPRTVEYREGLYVGYRYYDTAQKDVLFPFGFGLSYTTYEYSGLRLSAGEIHAGDDLTATLRVKNTGSCTGKEIVQLYVRDVTSSVFRPEKELKGFAKVELAAGEEKEVSITLGSRAFAYYDTAAQDWLVEDGAFEILIGASAADIRLVERVEIRSEHKNAVMELPTVVQGCYAHPAKDWRVSDAAFSALLGREMPPMDYLPGEPLTLTSPIGDFPRKPLGKVIYNMFRKQAAKSSPLSGEGTDETTALMIERMLADMPIGKMLMFSNGAMSEEMIEGMVLLANGKVLRGLSRLKAGRKSAAK